MEGIKLLSLKIFSKDSKRYFILYRKGKKEREKRWSGKLLRRKAKEKKFMVWGNNLCICLLRL